MPTKVIGSGSTSDANIKPENIKAGTSIYGITGTFTSDATATAAHILNGQKAYVNGSAVTGTMPNRVGAWNAPAHTSYYNGGLYVVPPKGFFNGDVGNWTNDGGVEVVDPDFVPTNILSTANIFGMQGSIPVINPNQYGYLETNNKTVGNTYDSTGKNYAYISIPRHSYINNIDWVRTEEPNLRPENIKAGLAVFDIVGTLSGGAGMYTPYYSQQSVTKTAGTGSQQTVNLTFDIGRAVNPNKSIIIVSGNATSNANNMANYVSNEYTISGNNIIVPFYFAGYDVYETSVNIQVLEWLPESTVVIQKGVIENPSGNTLSISAPPSTDYMRVMCTYDKSNVGLKSFTPQLYELTPPRSQTSIYLSSKRDSSYGIGRTHWWIVDIKIK